MSCTPLPLSASAPLKVVLPPGVVEAIWPPVQTEGPLMVTAPVPSSTPPVKANEPIEDAANAANVPPEIVRRPVPTNDCTVTAPVLNSVLNAPSSASEVSPGRPGFQLPRTSQYPLVGPTQMTGTACAEPSESRAAVARTFSLRDERIARALRPSQFDLQSPLALGRLKCRGCCLRSVPRARSTRFITSPFAATLNCADRIHGSENTVSICDLRSPLVLGGIGFQRGVISLFRPRIFRCPAPGQRDR
jgi:hypothetical protein